MDDDWGSPYFRKPSNKWILNRNSFSYWKVSLLFLKYVNNSYQSLSAGIKKTVELQFSYLYKWWIHSNFRSSFFVGSKKRTISIDLRAPMIENSLRSFLPLDELIAIQNGYLHAVQILQSQGWSSLASTASTKQFSRNLCLDWKCPVLVLVALFSVYCCWFLAVPLKYPSSCCLVRFNPCVTVGQMRDQTASEVPQARRVPGAPTIPIFSETRMSDISSVSLEAACKGQMAMDRGVQ